MKNVAVLGATGNLGEMFVKELVEHKFHVSIICNSARPANADKRKKLDGFKEHGAKIVSADFGDETALVKALAGIDVILSAMNGPGLGEQVPVIKAAAKAGVKRFIPSEFGINTRKTMKDVPVLAGKVDIQDLIKSLGLEYTIICTGYFVDTTFWDWFGWKPFEAKAEICGKGDTKFSVTFRHDIARFCVATIKHHEEFKNKEVEISAEDVSMNDVVKIFNAASGKKFDVTYVPVDKLEAEIKAAADQNSVFGPILRVAAEKGWSLHSAGSHEALKKYAPNPTTVEKFAQNLFAKK